LQLYRTPILLDDEPKIFGGKASLRQALYVLAGLIAACLAYNALKILSKETAVALAVCLLLGAAALAFFRVPGLDIPLDRYAYRFVFFYLSQREFPYKREG